MTACKATTTYAHEGLTLHSLAATRSDRATWSIDYLLNAGEGSWLVYAESGQVPQFGYAKLESLGGGWFLCEDE